MASTVDKPSYQLETGENLHHSFEDVRCLSSPKSGTGVLIATNFRILFRSSDPPATNLTGDMQLDHLSVPYTVVLKVESKKQKLGTVLTLDCRDFRCVRFLFPAAIHMSKDICRLLKLIKLRQYPDTYTSTFAVDYMLPNSRIDGWATFSTKREFFDRMKLDPSRWRICTANRSFSLCNSYPQEFIVAGSMRDASNYHNAQFRVEGRIPILCWINPLNQTTLWRSACLKREIVNDMQGLARIRLKEDEDLLHAVQTNDPHQKLHLVDCDAQGAGRCSSLLNLEYTALRIPSLPILRAEMSRFRDMSVNLFSSPHSSHSTPIASSSSSAPPPPANTPATEPVESSLLLNTKHLAHVSSLLTAASYIVTLMTQSNPTSVIVFSERGDEICTLLVSLAQVMMDSYYRSIKGFAVLFEKEWLGFGHKFLDLKKPRHPPETVSTTFILFLDGVWQLFRQFPQAFEFSETFLLFLADALYSCQFGTFLFSTEQERTELMGRTRTLSLWSYIPQELDRFRNPHYPGTFLHPEPILFPSTLTNSLGLWNGYYLRHLTGYLPQALHQAIHFNHSQQAVTLSLRSYQLPVLPHVLMDKLSHLRELDLGQNLLSCLPYEISQLLSLETLLVDHNQLTLLPRDIFSWLPLSLITISFRANRLLVIPESLRCLTNLTSIDFSHNCLTDSPKLDYFPNLRFLDLSNNSLDAFRSENMLPVHLEHLDLSRNALQSVSGAIAYLPNLKFLSLAGNQLFELPSLLNLQKIEHLDLSGLNLTAFPHELSCLVMLRSLNLSSMGQPALSALDVSALTNLCELDLSNNFLTKIPSSVLTSVGSNSARLSTLSLAVNLINDEGVDQLVQVLTTNTTLRSLFLHHNNLTNAGSSALSTFFSHHHSLVQLRLT